MDCRRWFRFLAIALLFSGCTKFCSKRHSDMSPEEVVEAYLSIALNMTNVSQREDLLNFTTDELKAAIAKVSDATIREAYIDRHYRIDRYSVVQRRDRTPRETEITFELQYRDLGKNSKADIDQIAVTTIENTVSLVLENKVWLIRNVVGNKTSIDFPILKEMAIKPTGEPVEEIPEDRETTDANSEGAAGQP